MKHECLLSTACLARRGAAYSVLCECIISLLGFSVGCTSQSAVERTLSASDYGFLIEFWRYSSFYLHLHLYVYILSRFHYTLGVIAESINGLLVHTTVTHQAMYSFTGLSNIFRTYHCQQPRRHCSPASR